MSKSLVDLAPRHAVREKNTSIKDINKVKQGRFNEGFNAEPIAFCICILYFEFKFPAKNSGEKFRFGRKKLGLGENFRFG